MAKIKQYIKKVFGFRKLNPDDVAHCLAKCAKSGSYIETLGRHSDALHKWIKSSYEVDFKRAFEIQVRSVIKSLRVRYAKLAFDITHEPFYGKTRSLHIFDTPAEEKNDGEFKFLTCCLINQDKQIPLMAVPLRRGEHVKLTIDLLKYCKSLFKNISCCLFDRGFYSAELIDFLEANSLRYLIFVPKRPGKLQSYLEDTEEFAKFDHKMKYAKEKSVWRPSTQIVICKNVNGFNWLFATNMQFDRGIDYVFLYKNRWQIETNYRVEDEAKIKSKSSNYMIRFFYFLMSLLLHMFWIVHKKTKGYVPFKKYLDVVEQNFLCEYLGISSI